LSAGGAAAVFLPATADEPGTVLKQAMAKPHAATLFNLCIIGTHPFGNTGHSLLSPSPSRQRKPLFIIASDDAKTVQFQTGATDTLLA
jgi:hypothetical protein